MIKFPRFAVSFFICLCCVSCETTTSQKNIDFRLVKIDRDIFGRPLGVWEFHNKNSQPIAIPGVISKSDGTASPSCAGFEIFDNGKWKSSGYFSDGVLPIT